MTKAQLIWFELYAVLWERERRSHQLRHVGIMEIARDDNLGSVTRIIRSNGAQVFSAQYDPWGVQTVTMNTIGFNRGYCGHEMLNGFQLINMRSATSGDAFFLRCPTKASKLERVTKWRKNGRLYNPYLGRSLSPDNYVQLPTSAQSFNRYSYCLNNPLWSVALGVGYTQLGSRDFSTHYTVGVLDAMSSKFTRYTLAAAEKNSVTYSFDYLTLPLTVGFHPYKGLTLRTGVQVGFCVRSHAKGYAEVAAFANPQDEGMTTIGDPSMSGPSRLVMR